MNFNINDQNGTSLNLVYNNVINNGNIRGNNRAWYTLTGNVQQNGGNVLHAVYPYASWTSDGNTYQRAASITVNPLANGNVDIFIDECE